MLEHRFTRTAALGLTLAVLAAPTAAAKIHDETVVVSQQGVAAPPIRDETIVQPQLRRATAIRDETVLPASQSAPAASTVTSGDGIDWTDAAIGAGGMLALIGLGLGVASLVTRHRRMQPRGIRKLTA